MVALCVLHINLLRQTFDQSLKKIFQSGQESVTEGQRNGQMDGQTKASSIIPHLLPSGGLTN